MIVRRKKTRKRGRNLSDQDIETILSILDGWTEPLSWPLLIDAIERRLHNRYTRQTLHKHERIHHAFRLRKDSLRGMPAPKRLATTVEMQALLEENARLKAENERLKALNNLLNNKFGVWAHNARMAGIDKRALWQPLPPVGRKKGTGTA